MKARMIVAAAVLVAVAALAPLAVRADEAAGVPPGDPRWLNGTWIGTVSHDPRPRKLEIADVGAGRGGRFTVTAVYGYADDKLHRVKLDVEMQGRELNVSFTSGGKTQIAVRRVGDSELAGTFVTSSGRESTITLRRATDDPRPASASAMTPLDPAAFVKEVQQALVGTWTGNVEGQNRRRVWIVQSAMVDENGQAVAHGAWGNEGGETKPVKARVAQNGERLSIELWTPSNSRVTVSEVAPDRLAGEFLSRDARTRPLTLVRAETAPPQPPSPRIQLVVLDSPSCIYCQRWKSEVLNNFWDRTEESKRVDVRIIGIGKRPADLKALPRSGHTPTFWLVKDGKSVGMIYGFRGASWWHDFKELLANADRSP